METERVIKQLEYHQLGLYVIFCILKAEAEFPEKFEFFGTDWTTAEMVHYYLKKKKSHQTAEMARNSTEYVYHNYTTGKTCNSSSQ